MGIDVYLFIGDEYHRRREQRVNAFTGKDTGATGYLRNPPYCFPRDNEGHPVDFDFIKETPNVLDHILNWTLSDIENLDKYFGVSKESIIDTKMDTKLTLESLDKVKSAIIKLQENGQEDYWFYKITELMDFMKLGIELQLTGKHPKVLEF